MTQCPECDDSKLIGYYEGKYKIFVCWKCGHYQSNSLAYIKNPECFKNMVREDPDIVRNFTHQPTFYSEKNNRRFDRTRLIKRS